MLKFGKGRGRRGMSATAVALPTTGIFVSPSGNDTTGTGTLANPYRRLSRAWTAASAGSQIWVRGGTYPTTVREDCSGKSGTSGNLIKIYAYPGETPIFDGSGGTGTDNSNNMGLVMYDTSYTHVRGLTFRFFREGGFGTFTDATYNNNIFENLTIHNCGAGSSADGKGFVLCGTGSNNLILNCDSYNNQDIATDNADGFMLNISGSGNVIRGCRAWNNSDDGFDFFNTTDGTVAGAWIIEDCWAYKNGYSAGGTPLGNGDGFKLGGIRPATGGSAGGHTVRRCISSSNRVRGIDDNEANVACTLYNNTTHANTGVGFKYESGAPAAMRNNLSFGDGSTHSIPTPGANVSHNSWQVGVTVNSADFVSVDATQLIGARGSDGSLPSITYMRLVTGSDCVNAGTNVGLSFLGAAPDLGAFEAA